MVNSKPGDYPGINRAPSVVPQPPVGSWGAGPAGERMNPDPASLGAAREAIDLAIGNCMRRRHEESDEAFGRRLGYLVSAVRDEAAALSGEPPAPTPDAFKKHLEDATRVVEGWPEWKKSALGVPPAAPTAAAPDPREDAGINGALVDFQRNATGPSQRLWRDKVYAAISDWHRRTLGGGQ